MGRRNQGRGTGRVSVVASSRERQGGREKARGRRERAKEREREREREEARVRIDLTSLPTHSVRIKQATVADVVLDDADVHVFVSRIFGGCCRAVF